MNKDILTNNLNLSIHNDYINDQIHTLTTTEHNTIDNNRNRRRTS